MGLVTTDATYQEEWDHLRFEGEDSHEITIDGTVHRIWLAPVGDGQWIGQAWHDGASGMKGRGPTRDAVFDLLLKECRWDRDFRIDRSMEES